MQEGGTVVSGGEATGSAHSDPATKSCLADSFAWKDVSFSVKTKDGDKQILSNVSGSIEKGRQTNGIWGPRLIVREIAGVDGTEWVWKDDPPGHPRPTPQVWFRDRHAAPRRVDI